MVSIVAFNVSADVCVCGIVYWHYYHITVFCCCHIVAMCCFKRIDVGCNLIIGLHACMTFDGVIT